MNALGGIILCVVVLVVLSAPRRWAFIGMMAGILYLTQRQNVVVLGFNIYAMRFVELAGFLRVMVRREFSFSTLNGIDRTFLLLYGYTVIVFLLRSEVGQANEIGVGVDAFLSYFAFRGLVTNIGDFRWFLRAFLLLLAPYVVLVLIESFTRHNPFEVLGAYTSAEFREDRIRCLGSFRHPSLLGTLGGSFLPLYIGLWFARDRMLAAIGVALCLAIVWASNSGGPVNCVVTCLVGWMLWGIRTKMRLFRRCLVGAIVLLAMVMKAPIWYLLDRVSSVSGGSGFHRAYLIDVAYRNLDKWWLVGMPSTETGSWFAYALSDGAADITNNFLSFGLQGGLVSMLLLIVLLTRALRELGKALAIVRSNGKTNRDIEFLYWSLGVMLAVHCVNWLGITYFDQTYVLWSMHLAVVSTLTGGIIRLNQGSSEPEARQRSSSTYSLAVAKMRSGTV